MESEAAAHVSTAKQNAARKRRQQRKEKPAHTVTEAGDAPAPPSPPQSQHAERTVSLEPVPDNAAKPRQQRRHVTVVDEGDTLRHSKPSPVLGEDRRRRRKKPSARKRSRTDNVLVETPIVTTLRELADNVVEGSGTMDDVDVSVVATPVVHSEHLPKIYVEYPHKFVAAQQTNQKNTDSMQLHSNNQNIKETPVKFAMMIQKSFRHIANFSHGLLAGTALWQLIMVYCLLRHSGDSYEDFIYHYSGMADIYQGIFYFLTVLCTVSVLDRYDVARFSWHHVLRLVTFQNGSFVILLYGLALVLTLVASETDSDLSLVLYNTTVILTEELQMFNETLPHWLGLNMCRAAAVIICWAIIAVQPDIDRLQELISNMAANDVAQCTTPSVA